jgi:hypothetical protein
MLGLALYDLISHKVHPIFLMSRIFRSKISSTDSPAWGPITLTTATGLRSHLEAKSAI